jgi:predicted metal-dependent hydrolase
MLPDKSIECVRLIRSKRRRYMSIRVNRTGVSVLSSPNEDILSIRNFISNNEAWILKKTKYYTKLNSKLEFGPLERDEIIYLGRKYKIQLVKDTLQFVILSENLMKITFHVKDKRTYKRNIVNWYREQTKKLLDDKVPFFGKKLSISYKKIRIRNQKLRWGSCSKNGNLNFNLLLSALPVNVIDYIVVHELFHLIEFNHSDKFWKLVRHAYPTYKNCRTWLKNHGAHIHFD